MSLSSWENLKINLLYQDDQFLVVSKPPGQLVAVGRQSPQIPLNRELENTLNKRVWTVHRLDRETSGLLVFATNPTTHRFLSQAFESHLVQKEYLALCWGKPISQTISFSLRKGRKDRMRICSPVESGMWAETRIEWIAEEGDSSLIRAFPKTGRTHQIRVHLAAIGHPLLGDIDYYPTARVCAGKSAPFSLPDAPRVMLHAYQLRFPESLPLKKHLFSCPPPPDFSEWAGERLKALKS